MCVTDRHVPSIYTACARVSNQHTRIQMLVQQCKFQLGAFSFHMEHIAEGESGNVDGRGRLGVGREKSLAFLEGISARYPDIPPPSLAELEDARTIFLDIRTEAEYATSTIPGALRELPAEIPSDDGDAVVVIFCTVGFRSGIHARNLLRRRFSNTTVNLRNYSVLHHLWNGMKLSDDVVHVWNEQHAKYAPDEVRTVWFGRFEGIWKGVQTGWQLLTSSVF